jgi:chromosome segregation protein
VYLRSIRLRGFKSFPDPTEVRLEPGVAVVVGPNGSGKSNVADAIVWAAGSLSPSELRAEKPDDVLFAGGGERAPTDFCEVELLFDNTDGDGPVDFSELAIARRLQRGGEGQYLLNRTAVRRIDLVELLADLGLGSGLHSIIGQGRVEEVLSSSPERRREMVEEAAGLGRFKRRRHRAELKLARVAIQVERARDVEDEVRKRLRPLALQATAAERAEKLAHELAGLRARVAELELEQLRTRLGEAEERRLAATLAQKRAAERLEALLGERSEAEDELADAAGRREQATAALYRLRSAGERLAVRRESAQAVVEGLRREVERPRRVLDGRVRAQREVLAERATLAEERLAALDHVLTEREGLPPAARALADEGAPLALAALHVQPGAELAAAAALGPLASALLAADPAEGLALLERARDAGLGSLRVLVARDPQELVDKLPVVDKRELLESKVPAVTREGLGYDPKRGELWFAGETAEAVLLELQARRKAVAAEAESLRALASSPPPATAFRAITDGRVVALADLARRLEETLAAAIAAGERFEAPLRARVDAGSARAQELGSELRRLGAAEVELRRESAEAAARTGAIEVELARLDAEAREAGRRMAEAGAEPADGDDREALLERVERLERRRLQLGQVNPLAKQQYESEKERLEELATQRSDLERSLEELEQLRADLDETVRTRFADTYASVEGHFQEVARTLFPGGEGRLRLSDPAQEDEAPGIEVELRPAGKRVTRLSLLSGGEKALGAISFLFALFLAKPCPFYLLDEVEAALDDTNIGRFVELLRRYADRAQFLVVTHQKRTMEAADILYGVTMGADGVSEVVSRRLPRNAAASAA